MWQPPLEVFGRGLLGDLFYRARGERRFLKLELAGVGRKVHRAAGGCDPEHGSEQSDVISPNVEDLLGALARLCLRGLRPPQLCNYGKNEEVTAYSHYQSIESTGCVQWTVPQQIPGYPRRCTP